MDKRSIQDLQILTVLQFGRSSARSAFYEVLRDEIDRLHDAVRGKDRDSSLLIEHGEKEILENAIIAELSRFESFLFEVIAIYLNNYPDLLLKKIDNVYTFDKNDFVESLEDGIKANNIKALIKNLVRIRIRNFSNSPRDYFRYFTQITEIEFDVKDLEKYYEIKASRDLIIHRNGIVDKEYLSKAGIYARGKSKKRIPINYDYYEDSIKLIGKIFNWIVTILMNRFDKASMLIHQEERYRKRYEKLIKRLSKNNP